MSIYITIKVTPGARQVRLEPGTHTDLVCAVKAPARDNAANQAVCALLADRLDCPKSAVVVVAGHTARIKRVYLETVPSLQDLWNRLDIPVQHAVRNLAGD